MTVEADIFDALTGLVSGRVYPDAVPEKTAKPYIMFSQVGGRALNFLDSAAPSKKNGRFQVSTWGATRESAAAIARQVEDTLRTASALQTTVLGAPVAMYDPETRLKGYRQDFSVWFDT